ncbi:hypothetical protein O0L34_g12170 [Tuta absoluta]|nr:hypothetical protein O0L34_g12170 [Tuta absoluta]
MHLCDLRALLPGASVGHHAETHWRQTHVSVRASEGTVVMHLCDLRPLFPGASVGHHAETHWRQTHVSVRASEGTVVMHLCDLRALLPGASVRHHAETHWRQTHVSVRASEGTVVISAIFVHFFPALLLDTMLRLTGGRPILWRLHKNVWNSLARLERFIFTEWRFHNPNTRELAQKLNDADKQLFYIDIASINWESYFTSLLLGVRRYLNHEKEKTLPAARTKDTMLLAFHVIWQLVLIWVLWFLVACLTGLSMTHSAWAAPVIYIVMTCL